MIMDHNEDAAETCLVLCFIPAQEASYIFYSYLSIDVYIS